MYSTTRTYEYIVYITHAHIHTRARSPKHIFYDNDDVDDDTIFFSIIQLFKRNSQNYLFIQPSFEL